MKKYHMYVYFIYFFFFAFTLTKLMLHLYKSNEKNGIFIKVNIRLDNNGYTGFVHYELFISVFNYS